MDGKQYAKMFASELLKNYDNGVLAPVITPEVVSREVFELVVTITATHAYDEGYSHAAKQRAYGFPN